MSNGVSNDHYKHTLEYGKFGEGQGKASSPSNWLFQLSTILNALHALISGIFLFSICQNFTTKRTAEAYMDDADCAYIDQTKQNKTPAQIRQKIQQLAQTWENLLYGTGTFSEMPKTKTGTAYTIPRVNYKSPGLFQAAPEDSTGFYVGFLRR
eukprot:3949801-Ditylum_brightwellii.AAC.1